MTDEQAPTHDFNPKHRVVGAIILVCVAVVVLPLILNDHTVAPPAQPVAEAPTPDTRIVVTPITPVPLPSNNAPPAMVKTIPTIVTPMAANTPSSAPSAHPAVSSNPTPSRNGASTPVTTRPSVPAVTASKPAVTKGWIVQVGAFSDTDNANRLKENLLRHGYAPELDKIALNKTQVVRVRVGPYGSEAEARTVLSRIQQELSVKGVVRVYP